MSSSKLDKKFTKVKREIQNATREAYKAMVASEETILGNPLLGNDVGASGGNDATNEGDRNCESSGMGMATLLNEVGAMDINNDSDNDRAGIYMGLALFGTSDAYRDQLEQEFGEKLQSVEKELSEIRDGLGTLPAEKGQGAESHDVDEHDDSGNTAQTTSESDGPTYSVDQLPHLENHVYFLQECTQARKLLRECDVLSLTNYATSTSGAGGPTSSSCNGVVFPFSPTSIYTPSSYSADRFTFALGAQKVQEGESPMVQAAQLVKQAEAILDQTLRCLNGKDLADSSSQVENSQNPFFSDSDVDIGDTHESMDIDAKGQVLGGKNEADKENNNFSTSYSSPFANIQSQILNELRHQTRRKKMELRHRAFTLLEGCIVVEKQRILVRGNGTIENLTDSTKNGHPFNLVSGSESSRPGTNKESPPKAIAASSASTSTPTNENASSISPSPLSDAYHVLEIFSDANFPTFGETLDRAMKILAQKLFVTAFQPCLDQMGAQMTSSGSQVPYFKLRQESLENPSSSISSNSSRGHQSGRLGRRYDPVSIKGPAVQLEWELMTANYSAFDNTRSQSANIAIASEITDEILQCAPSPPSATFLSSLNFFTNVFIFIHRHVLLERADLATLLGKHLFGCYPLRATMSSGSAVLGGILIGNAAQGEEEGEERPLMTELIKSMRKWCIQTESSPKVWMGLKTLEQILVREVGEFEGKMAQLGFMVTCVTRHLNGDVTENLFSPISRDFHNVSSPTGLSVVVNQDVVGSPMDPSASSPGFIQPLPVSTSPPSPAKYGKAILSPLSKLVHSSLQAYVEMQRSFILNHGRSILLTTDYHNSVQVGTFVPDPSEPGTLESLKDNPFAPFVFHQCSISTTAQKILNLCRETLEQATNPDAAHFLDALPPMLYRTSRELLDLFRALIPTLHGSEVGSIPRMAAILHNDCVFFAHEVSFLGVEYKDKFKRLCAELDSDVNSADERSFKGSGQGDENRQPIVMAEKQSTFKKPKNNTSNKKSKMRTLSEVCTFVDMVPPFRDLAVKSMGSMIELQKSQLCELVSTRLASFQPALESNESVTEWDDAETALRAALYHLRHLYQAWNQVLSRGVYHLSMGNLVDTVFVMFLDPVLKADAITEPASRFVHSLFLDAARGAAEMFSVGTTANNSIPSIAMMPTNIDENFKVASKYAILFDKLQAVGKFMIMRLDDIQRALGEGVFRSVTARELSHLIAAAFDESEKRRIILNALASK